MRVVLAVVFAALITQATQRTPPPVGVLIGIYTPGTDYALVGRDAGTRTVAKFRTIWVSSGSPGDSRRSDAIELPDLLVPRRAGFWRAGLVGTCAEAPHLDGDNKRVGTEVTIADYFWAAPVGEAAEVHAVTADERVGPCASRDISCDIDRSLQIFWVFPGFASVEQGLRASCGAHPDWTPGFAVQPLGGPSAGLSMDAVLGPRALTTFKSSFEEAKRREL